MSPYPAIVDTFRERAPKKRLDHKQKSLGAGLVRLIFFIISYLPLRSFGILVKAD
jgi:hypothetical protein